MPVSRSTQPCPAQLLRLPDGRTLGYAEFGVSGGWPVFYMHGLPASRLEARIAEETARRLKIRLISPDRPGMGCSDFQPGRTLAHWPEDIRYLADKLGLDRFAMLGVSGGGPYALACASRLPERIEAIGLVGSLGPLTVPELAKAMKLPARFSFHLAGRWPRLAALLYAKLLGNLLRHFPVLALMLLRPAKADRPILDDPDVASILRESIKEAFRQSGRGPTKDLELLGGCWNFDLHHIACPILLWHGEKDRTVPLAMGRYLAEAIPGCRARFYSEEGHFSLPLRHMEEILSSLFGKDLQP